MPNIRKLYGQLKTVSRSCGKPVISILRDFYILKKRKGLSWTEYYNFQFESQPEEFRKSFLGINEQRLYLDYLNPKKYYTVARNKYFTHLFLESAGITNKANLLCYYHPEAGVATLNIGNDYKSVRNILSQKCVSECVIKATESSHGDNVYLISSIIYKSGDCILVAHDGKEISLKMILSKEPLIFESVIKQTAQFCDFNNSSVNTIRFMTLLYPDKSVRIIATFIKIGRVGRCVDNAGAGGNVDAGIDVDTGRIYNLLQFDGWRKIKEISSHPDSGNNLQGVEIRNWKKIKEYVIKFQQSLPYIKAAGWDIAITDKGPVVVEVNDFWDTTGQLFIGRGWRNDIRNCYLEWKSFNNQYGVSYSYERLENRLCDKKLYKIAIHE